MDYTLSRQDHTLTAKLSGRLDAASAPELDKALTGELGGVDALTLDLKDVSYVSSAGLRLFIAMQRKVKDFSLVNVTRDVMDVLDMTGLGDLMHVERALKQLSITGLKPFASGMCGECYKIDGETILKLYREEMNPEWVRMEKEYAKAAFLLGIPTALSYDVVACGNRRGVLFELLDAKSLAATTAQDPEHLEDYARRFAQLGKMVHCVKGDPKLLPDRMAFYEKLLPKATWLSPAEYKKLRAMMDALPRADTCLHGDFHAGNVMVQGDELMFIDMGDFSIGHPMLDISLVYNLYTRDYKSDLGLEITKLPKPERERFFECFLRSYYGDMTPGEYDQLIHQLRRFACVRQLAYITEFPDSREENIAFMKQVLAEE